MHSRCTGITCAICAHSLTKTIGHLQFGSFVLTAVLHVCWPSLSDALLDFGASVLLADLEFLVELLRFLIVLEPGVVDFVDF